MPNELLKILVPAFIGGASGYFINQLPPLRTFRRSWLLVVGVVIELAVLGAVWAWLSGDIAQTSNIRGLLEKIAAALFGAFLVNILQLIWGLTWSRQSIQSTSSESSTGKGTVVKGTTMKGDKNKVQVNKNNAWVENTEIEGKKNEFSVTENSHNPPSSPQNNSSNP
ncbi:hypothetical protein [Calothrix sp. CCY 0018]|uniref:hypothetical protein n=1 Tax=Calothrix sp. CCY 0018 TaxID=3103864 RepID=UPI0039C6EBC5